MWYFAHCICLQTADEKYPFVNIALLRVYGSKLSNGHSKASMIVFYSELALIKGIHLLETGDY